MSSSAIFYLATSVLLLFIIFDGLTDAKTDAAMADNEVSELELKAVKSAQNLTSTSSSMSPLIGSSTSSASSIATTTTRAIVTGNVTASSIVTGNVTTISNGTTGISGNATTTNGTTANVNGTTVHHSSTTTDSQSGLFAFFIWIIFCICLLAVILCCCSICLKESPETRRRAHPANPAYEDHPSGWVRNDGPRMAHWPQKQPASPYSAHVAY